MIHVLCIELVEQFAIYVDEGDGYRIFDFYTDLSRAEYAIIGTYLDKKIRWVNF